MTYNDLQSKKIGVLLGGKSLERSTSLRSGADAYQALLDLGFADVVKIDLGDDPVTQIADSGIEFAFLALHGTDYEDGKLQGALEMLGVPYTGCGVLASAVGFDKVSAKIVARGLGVPTPDWFLLEEPCKLGKLGFEGPYIIKPCAQGSSLGVQKVGSRAELSEKIQPLFEEFGSVLIEKFIPGRDLTVGVVGNPGDLQVLPILEVIAQAGFYDREGKFGDETEYSAPANIAEQTRLCVEELARTVYDALQCKAVSRLDFRLDGDDLYFLEINTIPGMNSSTSNMNCILRAAGIPYVDFVKRIILDSI